MSLRMGMEKFNVLLFVLKLLTWTSVGLALSSVNQGNFGTVSADKKTEIGRLENYPTSSLHVLPMFWKTGYTQIGDRFVKVFQNMKTTCVLSDVDGTLLRSDHSMAENTIRSIKSVMKNCFKFIPCTGRTRSLMRFILDIFSLIFKLNAWFIESPW